MIGLHFLSCLESIVLGYTKIEDFKYIAIHCYNPYGKEEDVAIERIYVLDHILLSGISYIEKVAPKDIFIDNYFKEQVLSTMIDLEKSGKLVYVENYPTLTHKQSVMYKYINAVYNMVNFAQIPLEGVYIEDANKVTWLTEPLARHKKLMKKQKSIWYPYLKKWNLLPREPMPKAQQLSSERIEKGKIMIDNHRKSLKLPNKSYL